MTKSDKDQAFSADPTTHQYQDAGLELEAEYGQVISTAYPLGEKVRNRHLDQTGIIDTIGVNTAGVWYYVTTVSGMSIGWWHETDISGAPRTLPPSDHRTDG